MKAGQSVTPVSYLDLVGFGILWGGGQGEQKEMHTAKINGNAGLYGLPKSLEHKPLITLRVV